MRRLMVVVINEVTVTVVDSGMTGADGDDSEFSDEDANTDDGEPSGTGGEVTVELTRTYSQCKHWVGGVVRLLVEVMAGINNSDANYA